MGHKAIRHTIWALAACAVGLAGCQSGTTDTVTTPTGSSKFKDTLSAERPADAGIEMGANPSAGLPDSITEAKTMAFTSRRDPFALTGEESIFDKSQAAERLNAEFGGFGQEYTDTTDAYVEEPRILPKPAWRLSGVIISEGGVIGLLDMGAEVIQIRPGMAVPNSPYTVVSIDAQRAVLRRNDGMLPRDVEIDLSGPIGGSARPATGNGAPPNRGGFGGPPGGPPGRPTSAGAGGAAGAGK